MFSGRKQGLCFILSNHIGVPMRKRKYIYGRKRRELWEGAGKKCNICGIDTVLFTPRSILSDDVVCNIDHIIPFSKGGKCEDSNYQVLCFYCNQEKRDKTYA